MGGATVVAVLAVASLLPSCSQAASEQEQPRDAVLQAVTLLQGTSGRRVTLDKERRGGVRERPKGDREAERGRGGGGGETGGGGGGGGNNEEATPLSTFGLRESVVGTAATTKPPAIRGRARFRSDMEAQPKRQGDISKVPQPKHQEDFMKEPQPKRQGDISKLQHPKHQKDFLKEPQSKRQGDIPKLQHPKHEEDFLKEQQSKRRGDILRMPQQKRRGDNSKEPQPKLEGGKAKVMESEAADDEVVISTTYKNGRRGRARVVKVKRPVSETEARELVVELEGDAREEEKMNLSTITPSNVDSLGTWGRRLEPLQTKSHTLKPLAVPSGVKKTPPPRTRRPGRRPSTLTRTPTPSTTTIEPEATTYRPKNRPPFFTSRRREQNNRNRLTPNRTGTRTPPRSDPLQANTQNSDGQPLMVVEDVPRLPQDKPIPTPTPPPTNFLTPRPTPLPIPQMPTPTPGFLGRPVITTHSPPVIFTTPGTLPVTSLGFTSPALPGGFTSSFPFVTTPFTPLRLTPSSNPVISSPGSFFSSPRPVLFTPSVSPSPFAFVTPSIFTAINPAVPSSSSSSLSPAHESRPSARIPFTSSNSTQFLVSTSPQVSSSRPPAITTAHSPSLSTPRPLFVSTTHPAFVTTSRPSFFTTPKPSFITTPQPSFVRFQRPNIINPSGLFPEPSTARPLTSQLGNSDPGISSFFESSRTQSHPHEFSGRPQSASTLFGNTQRQDGRSELPTSFLSSHQSPAPLRPVSLHSLPSAGLPRPAQSPFRQAELSSHHRASPSSSFSPTPTSSKLGLTSFPSAFVFNRPTQPPRGPLVVSSHQPSLGTPKNHFDSVHIHQDGETDPFSFLKTEHHQNTNLLHETRKKPQLTTSSLIPSSMAPFFHFFSTRPPRAPLPTISTTSTSPFSGSFQNFNVPIPASLTQTQDTNPASFPQPTTQTPPTVLSPVNLLPPQRTPSSLEDNVYVTTASRTPPSRLRAPPPASPFFAAFGRLLPASAGRGTKVNTQTEVTTTNIRPPPRPPRPRPLHPTTSKRQDGPHPHDHDFLPLSLPLPPPPQPPPLPLTTEKDEEITQSLSKLSTVTGKSFIFFRTGNKMYQVVWQ